MGFERERTPPNAAGDFYVEKETCISCMAPESVAPELMGYDERVGCYFRRQPATPEELEHAVEAVAISCVEALHYAGSDPSVLSLLREKSCALRAASREPLYNPALKRRGMLSWLKGIVSVFLGRRGR